MAIPNMSFTGGAGGAAGPVDANSQVGTPINVTLPWNQIKNYQNKPQGSTQSANASANPTAGATGFGSVGGIDMKWILIGAAAWLLLRKR
ncbi:hypothetical protein IP92_02937 [Pseudoduganella flava]|uniref:GlyGly-CTERM sorting domain-containing protein n=1 Tax=Pseudoduganella flava TaxID=871742 RepID=A0A562PQC0_9BURK|nr:hypothetical protein [Pseudoduganella flava]QGZ37767.1 hypothetical protein GO485_00980 [Pseudoduganella flava]TWI46578.1 hypothetical protein IP92_02937 [Pseudoduganella flava]